MRIVEVFLNSLQSPKSNVGNYEKELEYFNDDYDDFCNSWCVESRFNVKPIGETCDSCVACWERKSSDLFISERRWL